MDSGRPADGPADRRHGRRSEPNHPMTKKAKSAFSVRSWATPRAALTDGLDIEIVADRLARCMSQVWHGGIQFHRYSSWMLRANFVLNCIAPNYPSLEN